MSSWLLNWGSIKKAEKPVKIEEYSKCYYLFFFVIGQDYTRSLIFDLCVQQAKLSRFDNTTLLEKKIEGA